jgi:hypothetical protein
MTYLNVKLPLCLVNDHGMKRQWWSIGTAFQASALYKGEWSVSHAGCFTSAKESLLPIGWVGPEAV